MIHRKKKKKKNVDLFKRKKKVKKEPNHPRYQYGQSRKKDNKIGKRKVGVKKLRRGNEKRREKWYEDNDRRYMKNPVSQMKLGSYIQYWHTKGRLAYNDKLRREKGVLMKDKHKFEA